MSDQNTPIPSELYMMLGKMDGKMDQNLAATTSLATEVKELANKANAHDARIAVLEKDAVTLRKHGHEIANIQQSLAGRTEQVREFREVVTKVNKLENWSVDHDAQEKGQGKLVKFAQAAIPVILSVLAALGVTSLAKKPNEVKTHYEATTTSPYQQQQAPVQNGR